MFHEFSNEFTTRDIVRYPNQMDLRWSIGATSSVLSQEFDIRFTMRTSGTGQYLFLNQLLTQNSHGRGQRILPALPGPVKQPPPRSASPCYDSLSGFRKASERMAAVLGRRDVLWGGLAVVLLVVSPGTEAMSGSSGPRPGGFASEAASLARIYMDAIEQLNAAHARKPGKNREKDLGKKLPKKARSALIRLLATARPSPDVAAALLECGQAALDLDLIKDFQRVRARLLKSSPQRAKQLGTALSHPRFLLRGLGGLDEAYLQKFASIFEAILVGYDELFGFVEWSKVPGKKLRLRVHREEKITRPPHFAPQFKYHSEIDFPVVDPKRFASPTRDGKFLFYGLCHELGHVIAMWGDRNTEEDHHAWAHYTGVVLVEHLAQKHRSDGVLEGIRDQRSHSLTQVRKEVADTAVGLADREGVLAFLVALHDAVGSQGIGRAFNFMDQRNQSLRINKVRYYRFATLRKALLATTRSKKQRAAVQRLFSKL